jgi:hypothetical protein
MGQLLRGAEERFNPQIHTEGNSLTTLMKKHFEIKRKSFDLFKKYNKFSSWMYYTGRVNQGIQKGKMKIDSNSINDNAYRIAYEGMDILPAYSFGAAHFGAWFDAGNPTPDMTANGVTQEAPVTAGFDNVETDTMGSISVKHDPANGIFGDKFNPNDKIVLDNGLGVNLIIQRAGRKASTGDHYVYDVKTIGPAALFSTTQLADGEVLTEAGNAFGEGSMKGSQRTARNKWRINYSFISRYTLTMTGSAKKQKIANIYNSDKKESSMWEFAEIMRADRVFRLQQELGLRYSRTTMDPSTHAWYENYGTNNLSLTGFQAESGIEAPITGDGWIPQIQDNATFEYNPNNGLAHTLIEAILNALSTRSPEGSSGNTFLAVTDRIGRAAFDRGMKVLMQYDQSSATSGASNIVYNVTTGEKLTLGFEVTSYEYLGNKIVVMEDELLNHPGLFPTKGGLVGKGHIYILNTTSVDGVPNFEVLSRSGRDYVKKHVNGMHSFDPAMDSSNVAASGFDGMSCHLLSELMPVLYDVQSCGILEATSDWSGGDLSGHTFAGQTAESFTF